MAHVSPQQVSPGDEITADSVNVPINQIAAQLNGNIDDSNISGISGSKIASGTLPTSAMATPWQYKIGQISSGTFGSTGDKSITGVGFKPKLVRFTMLAPQSASAATSGYGAMTETSQFWTFCSSSGSGMARNGSTSGCIGFLQSTSSTPSMEAEFVSMDDDGFTIKVTTASSAYHVMYEAYG